MDLSRTAPDVIEEGDNGEDCRIVNSREFDGEIKLGMQVSSEEEAYDLYNAHAFKKGFSIRKATRRVVNGVIRQREFVCSKQGFKEFEDPVNAKKFNHLDTRTGCCARIRFDVKDDVWTVVLFNDTHNHEFASPEQKLNLRSGRKVLNASGNTTSTNAKATGSCSCSRLSKEVDGANKIGLSKLDSHNYLPTVRKEMIEAGDGQSVFNHFRHKQSEDPMFFYSLQVDQDNRMANVFWRDGRSKLDYGYFGDVVIFDTFRINSYNLICAPFVGVNHHWKNVLFGCAFLIDETTESFIWLFKTFLAAMGGQQPKSIFTDQDQTMANAINLVFPKSRHRLCPWHISKNAKQHLGGLYTINADFNSRFDKCLNGCINEMEFESTWNDMIEKYNLQSHEWLNSLYEDREKWCTALSVDFFSAKLKSSQRKESSTSIFHQIMRKPMQLIQAIQSFEEKIAQMRQDESNEDFRCKNGAPSKVTRYGGILSHAASVYTHALFRVFEEELNSCLGLSCVETNHHGNNSIYSLTELGNGSVHIVEFDRSKLIICCSCKLFETLGLLCCHALRVFVVNNVNVIPDKYISNKWTKDAKKGLYCFDDSSQENEKSTRASRLSELCHLGYIVFEKAALTNSRTKIVKDKLREALHLVEKDVASIGMAEIVGQECLQEDPNNSDDMEPCVVGDKQAFDPPHVRKKRKRVKDAITLQTPQPSHMVHGDGQSSSSSLELSFDDHNFNLTRTPQESTSVPYMSPESTTSKDGMQG